MTKSGQAIVVAGTTLVLQKFTGGSFSVYDPSNNLLLSGNLSLSAVSGSLGNPIGGIFTASSVTLTGGSLQSYIDASTFQISLTFSSIANDGGVGLAVSPAPPSLPPAANYLGDMVGFTANATADINSKAIPEPATIAVGALFAVVLASMRRRRD
jgi:hypothetical protein